MEPAPQSVTQLLQAWRHGDPAAQEILMPLVYDELRRAAQRQMARLAPRQTLQPTALVNEVWMRLTVQEQPDWQNRAHFIAFCAAVMRNLLVDHFRRHRPHISLSEAAQLPHQQDVDVLRLHEALESLAEIEPRASRVVELKFFAGGTFEEVAEVLKVSVITVKRDWRKARAWLYHELSRKGE